MAVGTMVGVFLTAFASTFVAPPNARPPLERQSYAVYVVTAAYLAFCLYTTLIHPDFISPLRRIPRAKQWLPRKLYHTHYLRRTPVEVLSQIAQETPNDGLLALREATGVTLLVTNLSVLTELLISRASDFTKPAALQGYLRQLTLEGLLTVDGEKHKWLKKRSLSHFSFRAVKNLYPLMWRHALQFTSAVEANVQREKCCQDRGTTVEFADLTTEVTVNVIGTTVFGRAYEEAPNDDAFARLRKLVKFFLKPTALIHVYMALTFYSPPWVSKYLAFPMYKAAAGTSAAMEKLCLQLIDEKRESLKPNTQNADLASLMIKSGHFTDYEIASQLLTYMVAGQETTAATINWICYVLALDQRRQDILRDELETVRELLFVDPGTDVDIGSTLEELPFLNAVINETLRLYPTVPLTQRNAVQDTTLAGFPVPAGTSVYFSPWLIHRSQEVWGPESDQFRPERWIRVEENGQRKVDPSGGMKSNLQFTTFLHGPRNCIGQGFAKAELRCLTAALVTHFEWTLDMEEHTRRYIPMRGLVTLNPQRGLPLRLTPLSKSR